MKVGNVVISLAAIAVFGALAYYVYTKGQATSAANTAANAQTQASDINMAELQSAASEAYTENLINQLTTDPNGSTAVASQPAGTTTNTTSNGAA